MTRACPSATALLTGVVDYAGLFPPAALPMAAAVAEYARALSGDRTRGCSAGSSLPAARLAELGGCTRDDAARRPRRGA